MLLCHGITTSDYTSTWAAGDPPINTKMRKHALTLDIFLTIILQLFCYLLYLPTFIIYLTIHTDFLLI